jgi:hypothetical protein
MTKKYKDEYGMYLAIDDARDGYSIGWYDRNEGEFGMYLGDRGEKITKPPFKDASERESSISEQIASDFAKERDSVFICNGQYIFDKLKDAKECLAMINEALLSSSDIPMPEWARKARLAGWMPPDGWTP